MSGRGRGKDSEDKKVKVTRSGLKEALGIFRFVMPYKAPFIIGGVFLVVSGLTSLAFPFVAGKLIDAASGTADWLFNEIDEIALLLAGILLLQSVLSYFRIHLFAVVSEKAMADVRKAAYKKTISLPITFFEKRRVGEITSRLTSDVAQLQDVLSVTLAEFFRQIITLIIGIIILVVVSPRLSVFMLATFPFLVVAALFFGRFIRKLSKKAQDELAKANVIAEETLQAVNTVKAFSKEAYEVSRYDNALTGMVKIALKAARFRGAFVSFVIFALLGGMVLVLWYGANLVKDGGMTIGDLTAFILYTGFIGGAVAGMGQIYGQLQRTIGASSRIREIMNETSEVEVDHEYDSVTKLEGAVSYENVTFNYPSRPEISVLDKISFTIEKGEKIALVGHSGAGKSTIAQLLLRFYDVQQGTVLIDGKRISDYNITALRENIGIVPQEVMLFGGTLRENIAYGKITASDEEIKEAAQKANAMEFINRFPEGLDTIVGDRGMKLSGGQRQRIAIARAILKNPAILILDEATGSLDAESESLVQDALTTLMQGRTVIIIAHRLATVRHADTIFVLEKGRIVEQGSHEDLVNVEGGVYENLIRKQYRTA